MSRSFGGAARPGERAQGQGLVEFAIIVPIFVMLLLLMLEFGFLFDHHITIGYASREGARVGSALVNGGGALGCGSGQSPNASVVDRQIIAAVQRVLTSPGSLVDLSRVDSIRIYEANASGAAIGTEINTYTYSPGSGEVVDGRALDFRLQGIANWRACERTFVNPADSIGVSVVYDYRMTSGLGSIMRFFGGSMAGQVRMSDNTVMALNPTNI